MLIYIHDSIPNAYNDIEYCGECSRHRTTDGLVPIMPEALAFALGEHHGLPLARYELCFDLSLHFSTHSATILRAPLMSFCRFWDFQLLKDSSFPFPTFSFFKMNCRSPPLTIHTYVNSKAAGNHCFKHLIHGLIDNKNGRFNWHLTKVTPIPFVFQFIYHVLNW